VERNFASTAVKRDSNSRLLLEQLESLEAAQVLIDPAVYYDYPLFRDTDEVLYRSKLLLLTRSHGIRIFSVTDIPPSDITIADLRLIDDAAVQLHSIIFGKLVRSKLLRASAGVLRFPVRSAIVAPAAGGLDSSQAQLESQLITSLSSLEDILAPDKLPQPMSDETVSEIRSILEGAKGMIAPSERDVSNLPEDSKAAILRNLETEIVQFDAEQRKGAISIVDGPQRIRGLAGSGKTAVLAMKAAHLHLQNPNTDILVTFYTKSLYDLIKRLITRFYRQFSDKDPDWNRIHVLHAWGGQNVGGVYFNAALASGVTPLNFGQAAVRAPAGAFEHVCAELLKTGRVVQRYDYVLMDEAQDFPTSFFRLCFALCRGGARDRNVVWAYDELQNILNVRTRGTDVLFGTGEDGEPLMSLDRAANEGIAGFLHDIVLYKCYRNPLEVLICAHALGFGIYGEHFVQMLQNREHWEDVGYRVEQGGVPGERTVVLRPRENSPLSISTVVSAQPLVDYVAASDFAAEVEWVVESLLAFVNEGLRPEDFLIVSLDDRNARQYFSEISARLTEHDIGTHNMQQNPYGPPVFSRPGHVTLSTVYRAKGNEAPVVFCVGTDALAAMRNFKRERNKIFTAFTRAKAWLRVSGVGDGAAIFIGEIQKALKYSPRMEFVYPDPRKIETLQRDLSDKAAKLRSLKENMEEQLEILDLSPEEKAQFFATAAPKKK